MSCLSRFLWPIVQSLGPDASFVGFFGLFVILLPPKTLILAFECPSLRVLMSPSSQPKFRFILSRFSRASIDLYRPKGIGQRGTNLRPEGDRFSDWLLKTHDWKRPPREMSHPSNTHPKLFVLKLISSKSRLSLLAHSSTRVTIQLRYHSADANFRYPSPKPISKKQTIRRTLLPIIHCEKPSSAYRSSYPYFKTNFC